MKKIRIYPTSINRGAIDEAAEAMRRGALIVYPTDTLYAIGCDALNNRAIEQLCRVKGIDPRRQSLSVVCADISQASEYAYIDNVAFRTLKECLPGPYTFVLPAATTLPKVFKGRKTVGIRVPDNAIARELARSLGHPVLSASVVDPEAEGDDAASPDYIGLKVEPLAEMMIDGGEGSLHPSTVVDLTDSRDQQLLRCGAGSWPR